MYKSVKKTEYVQRYLEALSLHTSVPTVHWEYKTSCIYIVKAKRFNSRVKIIDIPVCFIQERFYYGLFFQNMRSIVSFRNKCAPNHIQVQLSFVLINL